MTVDSYMLWLTELCNLSGGKLRSLLRRFGTAEEVYHCERLDLYTETSLGSKDIAKVLTSKHENELEARLSELEKLGVKYISCENESFPALLRGIDDCPFGLYYKGKLKSDSLAIAVIGSRESTDYGINASYRIARELAESGVTIVSGMARGIDGMAHKGALDGKGYTIAVLGTAISICYPKEHDRLYTEIAEKGCVMSEYSPWAKTNKSSFAVRNRIISGLSNGVLVVEAAMKSGTSITVDQASSQGRDVFAVPGSIFSELSSGTNALIKDGAIIVTGFEDVLNEYGGFVPEKQTAPETEEAMIEISQKDLSGLEPDAKIIYDSLCCGEKSADELLAKSGFSIQQVLYCLTMLEISGFAKAVPGGRYKII